MVSKAQIGESALLSVTLPTEPDSAHARGHEFAYRYVPPVQEHSHGDNASDASASVHCHGLQT